MKKFLSTLLLALMCIGLAQAFSEQFKMFDNGPKTKTCRTAAINITNERDPLYCSYVFTPYLRNKKEGTLLLEFRLNPDNAKSVEIKTSMMTLLKNLKEEEWTKISLSVELKSGEVFTFDGSTVSSWSQSDWREILRVGYDRDRGEYRTYILFPLEQMQSSKGNLLKAKKRHRQILDSLQSSDIRCVRVSKNGPLGSIELEIPFQRPTDDTFTDMIKLIRNKK